MSTQNDFGTAVPFNDLRRIRTTSDEVLEAVQRVLASGWFVHGPEHTAFEQEFAAFCGVRDCAGVGNGTDALELALRAVRPAPGGVVLTAANAGGYTSVAARRAGKEVRYADVDPETHCLDPVDVARRLDGVDIVVVTHLYGRLGPVEELAALCRSQGLAFVEDCAQAVGAIRNGRRAGSFGDAATFSFYPTKNLGAVGDGGAVVSQDQEIVDRVRELRQYGWDRKYAIAVDGGRNSRLDEMQAAVLRVRLGTIDADNARRREIISRYADAASGGSATVLEAAGPDHVAHLAVTVADDREAVRAHMANANVSTEVHYPLPDHLQLAYRSENHSVRLPVTEHLAARTFSLPCFPQLTETEVDQVCAALLTA